jgi:hypothetical protein
MDLFLLSSRSLEGCRWKYRGSLGLGSWRMTGRLGFRCYFWSFLRSISSRTLSSMSLQRFLMSYTFCRASRELSLEFTRSLLPFCATRS